MGEHVLCDNIVNTKLTNFVLQIRQHRRYVCSS